MKRKFIFLGLFIIGVILILTITSSMIKTVGFDNITGVSLSTDKRIAYLLISLFGLIGYFVEVILERTCKDIKKEDIR